MKILVIGTGYVGLVTGVCFAEMGHEVICLDIDKERMKILQEGISPIYELGLQELLEINLNAGRISFTTDYEIGMKHAVYIFLALPTPTTSTGACDTSFIKNAVLKIVEYMHQYCLIVIKSTVIVGTGFQIEKWILEEQLKRKKNIPFDIVSNPEFLQEGNAITNFMKPDRVIIGVKSEQAKELMLALYKPFSLPNDSLLIMDIPSAEMNKYASNAMLACRISFMNEFAGICEKMGVDIQNVKLGLGKDKRIGPEFLSPGVGFGGSCFPKDLRTLTDMAKKNNANSQLLDAVISVNDRQRELMAQKVEEYFYNDKLENKIIAIWGLSFKPETDDIRDAPALTLIDSLLKKGANVRLFDPMAMNAAKKTIHGTNVHWAKDELDAIQGADALILMTEWKQFLSVDFIKVSRKMRKAVFFDGRNQFEPKQMEKLGFDYFCIGRPNDYKNEMFYS